MIGSDWFASRRSFFGSSRSGSRFVSLFQVWSQGQVDEWLIKRVPHRRGEELLYVTVAPAIWHLLWVISHGSTGRVFERAVVEQLHFS